MINLDQRVGGGTGSQPEANSGRYRVILWSHPVDKLYHFIGSCQFFDLRNRAGLAQDKDRSQENTKDHLMEFYVELRLSITLVPGFYDQCFVILFLGPIK